jgi:hypothetical protein
MTSVIKMVMSSVDRCHNHFDDLVRAAFGIPSVVDPDRPSVLPFRLGEQQLDDVINTLFMGGPALHRKAAVPGRGNVEISFCVTTALIGEDVFPVWDLVKRRVKGTGFRVPVLILLTDHDADALIALQSVTLTWKTDQLEGTARLLDSVASVCGECVVRIPEFLHAALVPEGDAP